MKKLVRVDDVADLLGCSKRHVWKLVESRELPAVRLGPRCVRFNPDDVQKMVESRSGK